MSVNEDFDRQLTRLLVETHPEPSDEGFVAAVAARVRFRRRVEQMLVAVVALAAILAVIVAGPLVARVSTTVAQWPLMAADTAAAFLGQPAGWSFSILIAALVFAWAATWRPQGSWWPRF
jgi:chromate transport protein ChrA